MRWFQRPVSGNRIYAYASHPPVYASPLGRLDPPPTRTSTGRSRFTATPFGRPNPTRNESLVGPLSGPQRFSAWRPTAWFESLRLLYPESNGAVTLRNNAIEFCMPAAERECHRPGRSPLLRLRPFEWAAASSAQILKGLPESATNLLIRSEDHRWRRAPTKGPSDSYQASLKCTRNPDFRASCTILVYTTSNIGRFMYTQRLG